MKTTQACLVRRSAAWISKLSGVCAFTILISFSALIKIPLPFTPVPITLQTLVVLLAGALLGPALGVVSVSLYIAMGIFGVPLFAGSGAGILYLFGPTGGYLLGFLPAALFSGEMTARSREGNIFVLYAVMLCGMSIIYLFGGLWLKFGFGWDLKRILFLGVTPFVIPDIIKAFIAAVVCKSLRYYRRVK